MKLYITQGGLKIIHIRSHSRFIKSAAFSPAIKLKTKKKCNER